jgi:tetratricopeptide (TPR) repeat protein
MGDQSIEILKNAQAMEPDNLDIGYELAEMYLSHGHISEGASQFRQIANSFLDKGQYEKAAEAFKRMKVVQSDDPSLLFTLGNIYVTLGRLNDAEAEFRSILRHDLNHLEALLALGNVCQQKGQFRDAILAFNKILSINPQENVAREKLGELYQAQGNVNEAIKQYLGAANAYHEVEENERAIRLYQRVVALDPTNPTACRELTNLGAPMEPEDPADLGSSYQPVIGPVSEGQGLVAAMEARAPEEEERPSRGRKGGRAKSEAGGASSLVRRDAGGLASGGKAVLPKAGLMSARGGGGLIAKGDGGPATLKPRLGGGGGEKPTMGAKSRMSEVAGSKPQLMRRGQDEPEYETQEYEAEEYEAEAPAVPDEPEYEAVAPQPEETTYPAPTPDPEPEPEPSYDTAEAIEAAAEPTDSGTGRSLDDFDPTLFPSLDTPSGREKLGAPPMPVAPPPEPEPAAPPSLEPEPEVEHEEPVHEETTTSRAPLQPRLFARGGGRSSGSRPTRPVLGASGGSSGLRGKGEGGKRTLPVRGHAEPDPAPVEVAEAVEAPPVAAEPAGPVVEPSLPPSEPEPEMVGAPAVEQFNAPVMPSDMVEGPPPDAGQPIPAAETAVRPEAASSTPPSSPAERPTVGSGATTKATSFPPSAPPLEEPSPLPVFAAPVASAPFDGAKALEELSRAMPADPFAASGAAGEAEVGQLEHYIGSGDMSRAMLAFRQHLQENPSDFEMRARLADALFGCGVVEEAATEYLQLAHLDPENIAVLHRLVESYLWSQTPERAVDLLVTMSYIHRQAGDTDSAFMVLHDALTVQRENARARLELAELYRQCGAPDLANWHLRAMAEIADETNDGVAAVDTWRKLYELSQSPADQEKLASVLEKYGHREEAAAEYRHLASVARSNGDTARARGLYEKVVELTPGDTEAQESLVAIYQTTGDDTAALDRMRAMADVARENGEFDTALRLYEELVRRDPANVSDHSALVALYLDKGLINNARNEAQGLLQSWYGENRFDLAIPLLTRLKEVLPEDIEVREQMVAFFEKAGEAERALEERIGLAHMHVARNAPEDALRVYQKAVSLDDRNAQVQYEMGVLYADYLNDPAAAEQRFMRVQLLDPRHKDAMRRLVQLQLQLGKAPEAVARLSDLIRLAPENASVRDDLVVAYERQVAEHPEDMTSRFTLGLLYRDLGKLDEAILTFQDTRKDPALFLGSCNMLGLCFWDRRTPGAAPGDNDPAIRWFKKGIETKGYSDEEYLELKYNLADLYWRRNELEEAYKLYQDIYSVDIRYRDVAELMKQLDDEMKGGGKVTRLRM